MPRGGKREGAGRKLGSTNRFSRDLIQEAKDSGELPLDFLLGVMRDEAMEIKPRLEAAKAAAPYVHHRLTAASVAVAEGISHEDWLRSLV